MTECVMDSCSREAEPTGYCTVCAEALVRIEDENLKTVRNTVSRELRQFARLMKVEPPLSIKEMAYRLVWSNREVRSLLRKFKDNRK